MNRLERVKTLIQERYDGNQTEFAKAIGKAAAQVNQWVNGYRNIGDGTASNIEIALNLPRGYLDGEAEAMPGLPMYRSDTAEIRDGWISIPRLSAVGELGSGALMDDPDEIVDFVMVLEAWARQQFGGNLKKLRIINTKGDSMQGTINHGDVVFVDSSVERFDGDGIYVLAMPAGLRIKRLQGLSTGGLRIISDNKAYETETVSGTELGSIRICGRVKGSWTLTIF